MVHTGYPSAPKPEAGQPWLQIRRDRTMSTRLVWIERGSNANGCLVLTGMLLSVPLPPAHHEVIFATHSLPWWWCSISLGRGSRAMESWLKPWCRKQSLVFLSRFLSILSQWQKGIRRAVKTCAVTTKTHCWWEPQVQWETLLQRSRQRAHINTHTHTRMNAHTRMCTHANK